MLLYGMRPSDLNPLLRSWGLKENDIQVLQLCMRLGHGLHVHEIVSATKMKRSTVDLVLTRLVERGLVMKLRTGQRCQYFPENPEILLSRQKQQIDLFETMLPLLQSWRHEGDAPALRVYQGIDGISEHYRDILNILGGLPMEKRRILAVDSGTDVMRLRPDLERFFIRDRVKRRIAIDIISPQNAQALEPYQTNALKLRECRYFKDRTKLFSMSLYLYHDRVALISLKNPLQVIVIQHPVVSQSMSVIWDILWESLA